MKSGSIYLFYDEQRKGFLAKDYPAFSVGEIADLSLCLKPLFTLISVNPLMKDYCSRRRWTSGLPFDLAPRGRD